MPMSSVHHFMSSLIKGLLSDFFEVKSLSLLRVRTMHLLLKLQSHLTKSLEVLVPLYSSLALQYLRLGYTGKAGTLFAQALKQMKDFEPSFSTQLLWHLSYAEYFARIGVNAKARSHVTQAGEIYSKLNISEKGIDPSERAERLLTVGRAGYVLSLIEFGENQLEKAIGHIDYAIRLLKTGITKLERSRKMTKSSPDYDPFSFDSKKEEISSKGVQFGSTIWGFKSVSGLRFRSHYRSSLWR